MSVGVLCRDLKRRIIITKLIVDFSTDLLSLIPKWKTQRDVSEKVVVYYNRGVMCSLTLSAFANLLQFLKKS